jgi:hypothetical protein
MVHTDLNFFIRVCFFFCTLIRYKIFEEMIKINEDLYTNLKKFYKKNNEFIQNQKYDEFIAIYGLAFSFDFFSILVKNKKISFKIEFVDRKNDYFFNSNKIVNKKFSENIRKKKILLRYNSRKKASKPDFDEFLKASLKRSSGISFLKTLHNYFFYKTNDKIDIYQKFFQKIDIANLKNFSISFSFNIKFFIFQKINKIFFNHESSGVLYIRKTLTALSMKKKNEALDILVEIKRKMFFRLKSIVLKISIILIELYIGNIRIDFISNFLEKAFSNNLKYFSFTKLSKKIPFINEKLISPTCSKKRHGVKSNFIDFNTIYRDNIRKQTIAQIHFCEKQEQRRNFLNWLNSEYRFKSVRLFLSLVSTTKNLYTTHDNSIGNLFDDLSSAQEWFYIYNLFFLKKQTFCKIPV